MTKRRIILLVIVIICIIIGIVLYFLKFNQNMQNNKDIYYKEENGVKINTSSKLKEEKVFDNIKITEINYTNASGITQFTANVQNVGEEDFEGKDITIVFLDDNGNEYAKVEAYIPSLAKGEMNMINCQVVEDKVNAYDFKILLNN